MSMNDSEQMVMQNDPLRVKELLARMQKFLEGKSVSPDGGRPVVTRDDMAEFNSLVQAMVEFKFGEDADSDHPVEFRLVDRTRYEHMHYWPIPYTHDVDEAQEEEALLSALHIAEMNQGIAHESFARLWREFEHMRGESKTKKALEEARRKEKSRV